MLSPFLLAFQVLGHLLPAVAGASWEALTTPGSEAYRPALAAILVAQVVAYALFTAYTLVTCVAFFQRRRYAPKLMIGYWVTHLLLLLVLDTLPVQLFLEEAPVTGPITLAVELTKTTAWCAYYLRSVRVERTFLR